MEIVLAKALYRSRWVGSGWKGHADLDMVVGVEQIEKAAQKGGT